MEYVFTAVIVILMAMVVVSLVRGINAFRQSTKLDQQNAAGGGATEMQLKQNRMMMARIKFQALAIIVVGLLLAMSR